MAAEGDKPVTSDELIRRAREAQESGSNAPPLGEAAEGSAEGSKSTEPTAGSHGEIEDSTLVVGSPLADGTVGVDESASHQSSASQPGDPKHAVPSTEPVELAEPSWKKAWRWGRWVVVGIVAVNVIVGILNSGQHVDSLEIGDCFMLGDVEAIADVETVDCSDSHELELYARIDIIGFDEPFPGDDAVTAWLNEECASRFEAYVGFDYLTSAYWVFTIFPGEDVWDSGDRLGLCAVYLGDTDGNVTSSIGSARNAGI